MATRASEVVARLRADAAWGAIFTGGTYLASDLGIEGLGSTSTPNAYASGKLLPTSLVTQRALIPTGQIRDLREQVADATQQVELYMYQSVESDAIEAGLVRGYQLLEGYAFTRAYPAEWTFTVGILPEPGNLAPFTMFARQDWLIRSVRKAA